MGGAEQLDDVTEQLLDLDGWVCVCVCVSMSPQLNIPHASEISAQLPNNSCIRPRSFRANDADKEKCRHTQSSSNRERDRPESATCHPGTKQHASVNGPTARNGVEWRRTGLNVKPLSKILTNRN